MKMFTAEDGTKISFEMIGETSGCQQFKIRSTKQKSQTIALVGPNILMHYKTLEILFARGWQDLKVLLNC